MYHKCIGEKYLYGVYCLGLFINIKKNLKKLDIMCYLF